MCPCTAVRFARLGTTVANLMLAMTPDTTNPKKQYHNFVAPHRLDFSPFVKPELEHC